MVDENLRTDINWIRRLTMSLDNAKAMLDALVIDDELAYNVADLSSKFNKQKFFNKEFYPISLFYLGMTTIRDNYVTSLPNMTIAPCAKGMNKIDLSERRYIDKDGNPQSTGLISLFNPAHISAILRNYNALKIETEGRHWDDFFYLMEAFDALVAKALHQRPG